MTNTSKTLKNNQFFMNGLIITDSKVYLNRSNEMPEAGRDYRIATLTIEINSSMSINNVKVFRKEDGQWYIELPGSFRRNQQFPEGRRYDDVRMTAAQFAIFRNYCYDRINEAMASVVEESED